MGKAQLGWTAAGLVIGLLVWDNWQLRGELAQVRAAIAAQAVAKTTPVAMQPAAPRADDCSAAEAVATASGRALPAAPAVAGPQPVSNHNTSGVEIPPGTDLLEAIKIIQREQAKNNPAGAAISPFGAGH